MTFAQRRLRLACAYPQSNESLLCVQYEAKDPVFLHADIKDSDQTGRMPRLIWVFAGRTSYFVGFVVLRLKYCFCYIFLHSSFYKVNFNAYKNFLINNSEQVSQYFTYVGNQVWVHWRIAHWAPGRHTCERLLGSNHLEQNRRSEASLLTED